MAEASAGVASAVTPTIVEELIASGLEPLQETLRRMEVLLLELTSGSRKCTEAVKEAAAGSADFATRSPAIQENDGNDSAPLVLSLQPPPPRSRTPDPQVDSPEVPNNDSTFVHGATGGNESLLRENVSSEHMVSGRDEIEGSTRCAASRTTNSSARNFDLHRITKGMSMEPPRESSIFEQVGTRLTPVWERLVKLYEVQEPARHGILNRFVKAPNFENLCALVIFTNTLFVAYTSDFEMKHPGQPVSKAVEAVELIFVTYYTIELILRLLNHRLYFFINVDMKWNVFDFVLVTLSLSDVVVTYTMANAGSGNISFMRIFRLLKLAKILRTLRVMKVFRDLAQILDSFKNCMISLFWSFFMMAFVIYVFALIFIQGLAGYIRSGLESGETDDHAEIQENFGSMPSSMLTLYMAVTGGNDWAAYYELVGKAGGFYGVSFIFFTFFFAFALFNILTGVFVEKAVCAAQPEREELIMEQRRKTIEDAAEFRHICTVLDTDSTGTVSRAEFHESMENDLLVSYMTARGLQVRDVDIFFNLLSAKYGQSDEDPSEVKVSIDDFVEGCMSMKGMATSFDVAKQRFELQATQRCLKDFQVNNGYKLEQMASNLSRVESLVTAVRALLVVSDTQVSTPRVSDARAGSASL